MTMECILHAIEEETGVKAMADTKLSEIARDSLEFLALMVRFNIPEAKVASIETVQDIYDEISD